MKSSFFFLIIGIFVQIPTPEAVISSFTQSAEATGPHGNITFECEIVGVDDAYWLINENSYAGTPNQNVIYSNHTRNGSQVHFLKLIIQALPDNNNNTKITCYVASWQRQDRFFIIANIPSKPFPVAMYSVTETQSSIQLKVAWDEPFTHPGFSVSHYALQIINSTTPGLPPMYINKGVYRMYTENFKPLPTTCYEVNYTVIAFNEIGNSSGTISVGIPIAIVPVDIQWRILYQLNGNPYLEVWFNPSNTCPYQEVNYTVNLLDYAGSSIFVNSSAHECLYSVHSGLTSGANYTVVVKARNIAGVTVTRQEIVIEKQLFNGNYEKQLSTANATSGILGALLGLVLIIVALQFICICKLYKQKKDRTVRAFSETDTASGVSVQSRRRPTSLQPKLASTNPIYEGGPLYESPGSGEPLCGFIGSTPSTPNTPLDSPRYIFDVFPPNLPPPRKSKISLLHDCPDTSPTTGEVKNMEAVENASKDPPLTTGSEEYTEMRPVSMHLKRASKPSPLTNPGLCAPSEVN